ncbi:hypothetical protein HPB47_021755 [Ixodes persulcatus]|uniref:Uncharacterized protein n=1 Tax=Ixodes persulcatus TaxID=34615 RepID=A0AC60QCP0_IXOPE|nr:hypothetical protein HPB47_021755 [Ixodes persulcatus]
MAKAIRHEFRPSYFEELVGPTWAPYGSKVKMCDSVDPYTLRVAADTTPDADVLPDTQPTRVVGIINYLVSSTNYVSLQPMKAFKALDAHYYFTS